MSYFLSQGQLPYTCPACFFVGRKASTSIRDDNDNDDDNIDEYLEGMFP